MTEGWENVLHPSSVARKRSLLPRGRVPHFVRVGAGIRRLLDYVELHRDVRRALERVGIHAAEPSARRGRAPDQLVDFVHHPSLMIFAECRALLEHDVHTLAGVVAAKLPALE